MEAIETPCIGDPVTPPPKTKQKFIGFSFWTLIDCWDRFLLSISFLQTNYISEKRKESYLITIYVSFCYKHIFM